MPLKWTIEHHRQMVVATGEGAVTGSDVIAYLEDLAAKAAMPYPKVFDISGGRSFLDADDLERLGAWLRDYMRRPSGVVGPLAIVVSSPEQFVQAQFFGDSATGKRPVRVFRDRAGAEAWLEELRNAGDPPSVAG
jgi:hypothetical protein